MGTATRVGFVGLGSMGYPMAARLREGGFALSVFDVRGEITRRFAAEHGATPAGSLSDLGAACDTAITMLPNGGIVRQVVCGDETADGDCLLRAMRPGSLVLDMSSSSPTGTQALGRLLEQRGMAMVDAPVSGGVARAQSGTLSIMAGGKPEAVERCLPVLKAFGERIFRTGALGSGHALKALNNLVSAAGLIVAAEALLIGRRFGLDAQTMLDVFNASTARNNSTENKFQQFVFSRRFSSGFSLDLMVKDLTTAVQLARDSATPAPFSAACRELWATAQSQLETGADHTAVVRWFESLAGATLSVDQD
jgi:3-hydroxyisobutyrate dehydrogenase